MLGVAPIDASGELDWLRATGALADRSESGARPEIGNRIALASTSRVDSDSDTAPESEVDAIARDRVRLKSRTLFVASDRKDAVRALEDVAPGTRRTLLLRLEDDVSAFDRAAMEREGIRFRQYLGDRTWFAEVEGGVVDSSFIQSRVRAAWPLQATDRIDPALLQDLRSPQALTPDGTLAVSVLAFRDADLNRLASDIRSLGGEVQATVEPFDTLFASIPREAATRLASLEGVHWLEAIAPAPGPEMNRARAYLDADEMTAVPYSLTGYGVEVSINDRGHAWPSHPDLASRWIQGDAGVDALSVDIHPTMTAGTIAGNGSLDSDYRGFAIAADLITYSFAGSGDPTDITMANLLGDIDLALQRGVDVANNSWGFFCDALPYGDYTSQARVFDQQVLGRDGGGTTVGDPTVVVFSAGNERNGSGDGTTDCITNETAPFINYGTINQPKPAKNIIAVGAVDSANGWMTDYSSWGPTSDGRIRPDVVAVGHYNGTMAGAVTGIDNCFGTPTGSPNQQCFRTTNESLDFDGYAWFSQTSAAAAMVSGTAALLIEDFRSEAGRDPLPSTVKALLIHTATDLNDATSWYNPGPDYASGHGLVDVQAAVDHLRSGHWVEHCLNDGETDFNTLRIPVGAGSVKATLVWSDVPASPATSAPALVNDLDLVLTDSTGARRYPWTLDPSNPSTSAIRTTEDHLNNVEVVLAEGSVPEGDWSMDVVGTSISSEPQCYSLVFSPFETVGAVDVDQYQLNGADQNQAIFSGRSVGQTFTVGREGLLDSIEVSFSTSSMASLNVDILDMTSGDPALAPVLGSVAFDCCDIGPLMLDFFDITAKLIDVSPLGIGVEPGDLLAFRITSEDPCCAVALRIALTDSYPGGELLVGDTLLPGADVAFKTFVLDSGVDQSQLDGSGQNQAIYSGRSVGQSFTAGRSGPLEAIELSFSNNTIADVTVEILDMTLGDPALAPILGSTTFECCSVGPLMLDLFAETGTLVDLSLLGISVDQDDLLAFRVSSDAPCCSVGLRIGFDDPYPGGEYFVNDTFVTGADAAFKTYIPLPEPANAIGLVAGSLLLLLLVDRRSPQRAAVADQPSSGVPPYRSSVKRFVPTISSFWL